MVPYKHRASVAVTWWYYHAMYKIHLQATPGWNKRDVQSIAAPAVDLAAVHFPAGSLFPRYLALLHPEPIHCPSVASQPHGSGLFRLVGWVS